MRLTWGDVDFRRKSVRVEKAKGGKTRTLPLPTELVAALMRRKRGAAGDPLFGRTTFPQKDWNAAQKAAGLLGRVVPRAAPHVPDGPPAVRRGREDGA